MRKYTNQNLTAAQIIAVTTDWVARDDVRARIRSTIKRLLAKHGYPPDAEADSIRRVLDQMETFADDWSPGA